jgi:hypothetical protein
VIFTRSSFVRRDAVSNVRGRLSVAPKRELPKTAAKGDEGAGATEGTRGGRGNVGTPRTQTAYDGVPERARRHRERARDVDAHPEVKPASPRHLLAASKRRFSKMGLIDLAVGKTWHTAYHAHTRRLEPRAGTELPLAPARSLRGAAGDIGRA